MLLLLFFMVVEVHGSTRKVCESEWVEIVKSLAHLEPKYFM